LVWRDGFGCAVNIEKDVVLEIESVFKKRLAQFPGDEDLYLKMDALADGRVPVLNLSTNRLRFEATEITFRVGNTAAEQSSDVFFVRESRAGMSFFWSLTRLYKAMRLRSYCGEPSKWIYTNAVPWENQLAKAGFAKDNMAYSTQVTEKKKNSIGDRAFLPSSSTSTLGFLFLLCRWSSEHHHLGGLQAVENQKAAAELLEGVVAAMHVGGHWKIPLYFVERWASLWPLFPEKVPDAVLLVNESGDVDVSELVDRYSTWKDDKVATTYVDAVFPFTPTNDDRSVKLVKLLELTLPSCLPFWCQTLWAMARRVERYLWESLNTGAGGGFRMVIQDILSLVNQPRRLNNALLRLTLSGRDESAHCLNISRNTDESNVGGKTLSAGMFSHPNNKVAVVCPKVFFGKCAYQL